MRGVRIAFLREVSNPPGTRKVLVEMAQQRVNPNGRPGIDRTGILIRPPPFAETYPARSDTQRGDAVAPQVRAFLFVAAPE